MFRKTFTKDYFFVPKIFRQLNITQKHSKNVFVFGFVRPCDLVKW